MAGSQVDLVGRTTLEAAPNVGRLHSPSLALQPAETISESDVDEPAALAESLISCIFVSAIKPRDEDICLPNRSPVCAVTDKACD